MVFVDPLTIMLVAVAASAGLIAMYLVKAARGSKSFIELAVPSMVIGAFDFVSGFFMSFGWPFPGPMSAYNMLFGDPMLFLGLIMVAGGYMLYKGIDIKVLSYFGFLLGIYLFVESYAMVAFKLESGQYFLPAFSFYLLSALVAFLSPLMYMNPKKGGKSVYYFMTLLLVLVAFLALFIGSAGIYGHLASPP
ncbi:MAG: DUF981 family protein [Candidatus Micrarchaeia archaeon]